MRRKSQPCKGLEKTSRELEEQGQRSREANMFEVCKGFKEGWDGYSLENKGGWKVKGSQDISLEHCRMCSFNAYVSIIMWICGG